MILKKKLKKRFYKNENNFKKINKILLKKIEK